MLDEILKIAELLNKDTPKEVRWGATRVPYSDDDDCFANAYYVDFVCPNCLQSIYKTPFAYGPYSLGEGISDSEAAYICNNEKFEHFDYCYKCGQKIRWLKDNEDEGSTK